MRAVATRLYAPPSIATGLQAPRSVATRYFTHMTAAQVRRVMTIGVFTLAVDAHLDDLCPACRVLERKCNVP
jgi:hypothetical protein